MPKKCPTGYFCLNQVTLIGILFLLIIIIVFIFKENYNSLSSRIYNIQNENAIQNQLNLMQTQKNIQAQNTQNSNNHHNLNNHHNHNGEPPTRHYNNGSNQNIMPINIETRGSSGDFQQIGILTKDSVSDNTQIPGNNTDSNILPLYGKRLYRGSNKWYYYTITDKFNSIKIPLIINNKDCTDDKVWKRFHCEIPVTPIFVQ